MTDNTLAASSASDHEPDGDNVPGPDRDTVIVYPSVAGVLPGVPARSDNLQTRVRKPRHG
jgi:hypothetical protein